MLREVSLLVLAACIFTANAQVDQGSPERRSDVQLLLNFRNSIDNWDEYSVANSIRGWDVNSLVCTWTGVTCSDIGDIVSLSLQCSACPVKARGTLFDGLAGLSRLTTLNLEGQAFRGGLPVAWFQPDAWPQLQNMFLSNNPLGGSLPETRSGSFRVLNQLRLNECGLLGQLPVTWGRDETSMRYLNVLRAANNSLNGSLPEDWGTAAAFPALTTIDLSDNQLSGILPNLWSDPRAVAFLQEIFLKNNHFTGGLPPGFGNVSALKSLRYLNLANNPLGGEIPSGWSQPDSFPTLRSLDLNDTGLSGQIPAAFPVAFPQLDALRLAYNNFSGPLPLTFQNFSTLQRLIIKPGNPLLCGPIPPDLPFQLCDDTDLTCLRVPIQFLPQCPPNLYPDAYGLLAPSATNNNNTTAAPSSSSSSNTAAIVGGVVGGVVGLLALITAVTLFILFRRRNRRGGALQKQKQHPNTLPSSLLLHQTDSTANSRSKPSLRPFMSEEEVNAAAAAVVVRESDGDGATPTATGGNIYSPFDINSAWRSGNSSPAASAVVAAAAAASAGAPAAAAASPITSLQTTLTEPKSSYRPLGNLLNTLKSSQMLVRSDLSPSETVAQFTMSAFADGNEEDFEEGGDDTFVDAEGVEGAEDEKDRIVPGDLHSLPSHIPWSDWEVSLQELEVCYRPDGTEWVLGSGGFGKVYKALRNAVQPVAVKVIPSPDEAHLHAHEQIRREIAILRACRDANIVQFQGAYLGPEETLLVTEYMEGGDLMSNIAAGRVTWWRRGRKIAIDVAKGLSFLHARRIVHFDLKSPNILLTRDGTAKIADVGMAKFLAQDYVTGVIATLAWSAPEMLFGQKCSEKADIYSYGILMWEICAGEQPERGRLRDIRVPEECPEEVRQIVLECLETRPSARPTAVQIVERLQRVSRVAGQTSVPAAEIAAAVVAAEVDVDVERGDVEEEEEERDDGNLNEHHHHQGEDAEDAAGEELNE